MVAWSRLSLVPMIDLRQRRAGVLAHLTSLPGPHGVGDLGPAAFAFVDWLQSAGQRLWQWLPTTPIGPGDSPYQSVSAFAGSPLLVALEPLVACGWLEAPSLPAKGFEPCGVDFARVAPWRLARLRDAFAGFRANAEDKSHGLCQAWCRAQADWLDDYALFMALETALGGQPWWRWPAPLRERNATALAVARIEHASEMAFWQFVQWCFDGQLAMLKAYANERDVRIVGDLPIFVAHHSTDCWARPDLYELDADYQPTVVAGVPPDNLSPLGQRWGNPLYRWQPMADEHFAWWTARMRRALSQTDIFRIDHFRGFAAYWEIPASSPTAVVGRWVEAPGQALFAALAAALGPLPIIAEDLGTITPDVIALRDGCGLPGMKILQLAFGSDGTHEFLPHNYPAFCVVYSGTHDNDTARGWWHAAPTNERHYAERYLACSGDDVHWGMVRAACNSVACMAVFALQDVLGLPGSARMNIPGTLGGNNWTWRFSWAMLGPHTAQQLGRISAASGRAPMALLA